MIETEIIKEKELIDALRNGAVETLYIRKQSNGNYQIEVTLTWKPGTFILTTSRNRPREWVSLDRLHDHLREAYIAPLPSITLNFRGREN